MTENNTPTDDEREALIAILEAPLAEESRGRTFSEMLADVILVRFGFRRTEVPEPSAEGYAEFESWEQEMFRHQPVLSMADGSIAGCQCLDRVFVKGREDWGTHLASVITSRLGPEPQGEPSDAQVEAAARAIYEARDDEFDMRDWDDLDSQQRERYVCDARAALRAAGFAGREEVAPS